MLAVCSLSLCCACSASLHNKAEVWLLRHPLPNPARHLSCVVIHVVVLPCDWQRWRRLIRLWLHGVQSAVNAQDSLSQQRLLLAMPLAMPDSTFPPRALSEGGGWRWKGGTVEWGTSTTSPGGGGGGSRAQRTCRPSSCPGGILSASPPHRPLQQAVLSSPQAARGHQRYPALPRRPHRPRPVCTLWRKSHPPHSYSLQAT